MHQAIAFRVALVAAGDRGDAEEAVQDGFVKAHRALGRFREGAPFRPWLLRIVANEARNRRRSAGRRTGLALRAAAAASGDAAPSPEAAALSHERREELLAALARLEERDRDVLVHRYLLGLSEEETAEALGVRRGTVKSRTARALELNVTNEGGIDGTYRLLKNIMGLWLVQECRRSFERRGRIVDYDALARLAADAPPFRSIVDPDNPAFLAPDDMPTAIQAVCKAAGQPIPETEGELVRCALDSLALKYRLVLERLEILVECPPR